MTLLRIWLKTRRLQAVARVAAPADMGCSLSRFLMGSMEQLRERGTTVFGFPLDKYRIQLDRELQPKMALKFADKFKGLELMPGTDWICQQVLAVRWQQSNEGSLVARAYWTAVGATRIRKLRFDVGQNHILRRC